MSSATASGADAGGARNREHNQGNQGRTYTVEQKAAVLRIRRCSPTAFYDILGLEEVKTTVTESEIKKAYRKLSLLTHPDKNGHEHADEAFKMVSRAFGVLGDKEKREKFDRFGTDPDSRFGQAQAQNPFSGFGRRQASGGAPSTGGGGGWGEEEMTPEEMFQRFFGGGFGGPFGGGFDTGPQFVFNFGGGPGFRVHQFGGARPRRRPREATQGGQEDSPSGLSTLLGLLPILFLFIFPLLSSIFSGGEQTSRPYRFEAVDQFTMERTTPRHGVHYFVDPSVAQHYSISRWGRLEKEAEVDFIKMRQYECDQELRHQRRLMDDAQGWFFQDPEKLKAALAYEKTSCQWLQDRGLDR